MKTLIVGSSRVLNLDSIHDAISQSNIDITELVMGSYFGICPVISTYANVKKYPNEKDLIRTLKTTSLMLLEENQDVYLF